MRNSTLAKALAWSGALLLVAGLLFSSYGALKYVSRSPDDCPPHSPSCVDFLKDVGEQAAFILTLGHGVTLAGLLMLAADVLLRRGGRPYTRP